MSMFPLPDVKRSIIAVLFAAVALLSGCSMVRIGYNQAPDLVYWWLDAYADFNDNQTPRLRDALAQWFAWNRRTQLPDYVALLQRAQAEVQTDTTPERACAFEADLRTRIDTAVERAVPAAAELAQTLTPEQIQHIERRYAKVNDEFRGEYLQSDRAERARASGQRAIDRIEMVYGSLEAPQLELIRKAVAASPFDPVLWLQERQRRQQDVLQMLRRLSAERPGAERAQAAVRAHVLQYRRSPNEAYRNYSTKLTAFNCAFAATLHNATTPAQRQVALQRFKGWEADFRALNAESAP